MDGDKCSAMVYFRGEKSDTHFLKHSIFLNVTKKKTHNYSRERWRPVPQTASWLPCWTLIAFSLVLRWLCGASHLPEGTATMHPWLTIRRLTYIKNGLSLKMRCNKKIKHITQLILLGLLSRNENLKTWLLFSQNISERAARNFDHNMILLCARYTQ